MDKDYNLSDLQSWIVCQYLDKQHFTLLFLIFILAYIQLHWHSFYYVFISFLYLQIEACTSFLNVTVIFLLSRTCFLYEWAPNNMSHCLLLINIVGMVMVCIPLKWLLLYSIRFIIICLYTFISMLMIKRDSSYTSNLNYKCKEKCICNRYYLHCNFSHLCFPPIV